MRIKILYSLAFLLLTSLLEADNCKLDIGAGYRQDHFVWELAGPKKGPPVLSRLTWKDLRIFDAAVCFKKITCNNIYFRVLGDYGRIFHGENRDSDFRRNNKGQVEEYTRFDNNGGEGDVWDFSAGIGYFIKPDLCYLRIVPLAGFSVHEQNLHMYDGFQSRWLDIPNYPGHHFKHLHSTYRARWYGPWLGTDLYYHINDRITLNSYLEYHGLFYQARGHWNLRRDFAGDFHHHGYGHGWLGTLGIDYNFLCGFYLGGYFSFNYFHVSKGRDKTPVLVKPENENPKVVNFVGKLKAVKWHSFSAIFTAGYNF